MIHITYTRDITWLLRWAENDFFHFQALYKVDSFVVDYCWWFSTKKWSLAPKHACANGNFERKFANYQKIEKMHIFAQFIHTEPKIWPQLLGFTGRGTKYWRQKLFSGVRFANFAKQGCQIIVFMQFWRLCTGFYYFST